jgi:hypothetical protein
MNIGNLIARRVRWFFNLWEKEEVPRLKVEELEDTWNWLVFSLEVDNRKYRSTGSSSETSD